MLREEGAGDPAYVYDEEKELFRFRDGRFAFSGSGPTGGCYASAGGWTEEL